MSFSWRSRNTHPDVAPPRSTTDDRGCERRCGKRDLVRGAKYYGPKASSIRAFVRFVRLIDDQPNSHSKAITVTALSAVLTIQNLTTFQARCHWQNRAHKVEVHPIHINDILSVSGSKQSFTSLCNRCLSAISLVSKVRTQRLVSR